MHKTLEKSANSRSTKIKYLSTVPRTKPLQEPEITSSEKLTCCVNNNTGNSDWEAVHVNDLEEDSDPSLYKSSMDLNSNLSAVYEELFKNRLAREINGFAPEYEHTASAYEIRPANEATEIKHKGDSKMLEGDKYISRKRKNDHLKKKHDLEHPVETQLITEGSETKKKVKKKCDTKNKRETKAEDCKQLIKEEEDGSSHEDDELKTMFEDKAIKLKELKGYENYYKSRSGKSHLVENDHVNLKGKDNKNRDDGEKLNKRKRKKEQAEDNDTKKKKRKKEELKTDNHEDKKEEENKWKWWEEGQSNDGKKWKHLEHKGPLFPPEYEPLPQNVSFYYNGMPLKLSMAAEEVATFYAKMLDHEYTSKEMFQKNFFMDWREEMTPEERDVICELSECDFMEIHRYFVEQSEKKKAMTKEEKQALKEETKKLTDEFGYCLLDGHKEKIGNFRVEPPGLFRGRGEHPKMGKLKKRILPEDITINCGKDSKIPEPPKGHKWKKIQHDDAVTWLASWVENVQGSIKYIMLNPSSKLKGEKDWQKYEIARKLKLKVDMIRREYERDWKSKEMKKRQRGVAMYFIDKLALRAGNEKEEGETADTVGCCSLRVEHITLHKELDGQECVVEFDFLGKDSIRYYNKVPVEKKVFKNLKHFMENKDPEDDLFDRINASTFLTSYLNKTLNNCMTGLTAKVFRTFNASTMLQEQLSKLTLPDMTMEEKLLAYNRANRAVAILCNHQRAAPKTFEKSMQNLQDKIELKQKQLDEAKAALKKAKSEYCESKNDKQKRYETPYLLTLNAFQIGFEFDRKLNPGRVKQFVTLLKLAELLTYNSIHFLHCRCKKFGVPIEKIYNKTQRDKFAWAIDMTNEDFEF
ncbi:hypothetical protein GN956_G21717 [Arapaima gigas]